MQRRIKRPVAAAVGCVLLAGISIGAVMVRDGRASRFDVVSRWSGGGGRLESGSLGTDPGRGFLRWTPASGKPLLFTTPEGAGALRLISHSSYSSTFRSSNGALVFFSPGMGGDISIPPSFEFLGPRLDPAKLGRIGPRGLAVSIDWPGKRSGSLVVLVEQTPGRHGSFGYGWKVDGYLPGFSTPLDAAWRKACCKWNWAETAPQLSQPLLGPDGQSYSIDAKDGRLVRIGRTPPVTLQKYRLGGCTTWPGSGSASYRACSRAITLRPPHGAPVTLLRRDPRDQMDIYNTAWTFLQPSPNGRWLLLEDTTEACSVASWAEFMPAHGGPESRVFPESPRSSGAVGWLPDNTALVWGTPQACGGSGAEGIYHVRPGTGTPAAHQLVFPATSAEVTSWGFAP